MSWATLHPIWFFRIRYPYDSRHVQKVKKERRLDCKILWMDRRFFIHFESHKLFHTSFAFKNSNNQFMLFHLSMLYKNHHVMEITIGHSNHTSYVNLIVQKFVLEHKYDMDCKQALITLIELKTYIHMCNQDYSSN